MPDVIIFSTVLRDWRSDVEPPPAKNPPILDCMKAVLGAAALIFCLTPGLYAGGLLDLPPLNCHQLADGLVIFRVVAQSNFDAEKRQPVTFTVVERFYGLTPDQLLSFPPP